LSQGAYLEEDLGDTTLFDFLSQSRVGDSISQQAIEAYRKVVAALPRFQIEAGRNLNYKVCYPRGSFDRQSIAWDLNYFKYYFLRLAGIPFNEQALEHDFGRLTKFLLSANHEYFLYRDFQSRNVMLRDGQPFFLDYQGGRKGALHYDIASLLYDGKADLPPELRQELLDYYLDCLGGFTNIKRDAFMEHYYAYVYVRIMQALGAYGFRGFYERKAHFLQSVPYALKNLRWLAQNVKLPIDLPALMEAFQGMSQSEKLLGLASSADVLTVRVFSFSFHGEKPADETGNGGGFVFDARSLPNPGREEQYRELTGKDAAVIDYLNHQETVHRFLASVLSLVESSVNTYQRRGFKSLMISFGCTGGQHRSVYLAEQLAKHLRGSEIGDNQAEDARTMSGEIAGIEAWLIAEATKAACSCGAELQLAGNVGSVREQAQKLVVAFQRHKIEKETARQKLVQSTLPRPTEMKPREDVNHYSV
jgi:aminoglycoside/choline kinase family phosphotransferase